jgi:hypothetical protein
VWPDRVVLLSPLFCNHPGFYERIEDLTVQELISQLAIEEFDVAVLPELPGSMKSVLTPSRCDQSRTISEVNSGPLSERR